MPDRVFVHGLALDCVIGVATHERNVRQRVVIDLEIEVDCSRAGQTDDLAHALDYQTAAERTKELVERSSFQLIEALAEHVAEMLLAEFPTALKVTVTIEKPGAARWGETLGVLLERTRSQNQTEPN